MVCVQPIHSMHADGMPEQARLAMPVRLVEGRNGACMHGVNSAPTGGRRGQTAAIRDRSSHRARATPTGLALVAPLSSHAGSAPSLLLPGCPPTRSSAGAPRRPGQQARRRGGPLERTGIVTWTRTTWDLGQKDAADEDPSEAEDE